MENELIDSVFEELEGFLGMWLETTHPEIIKRARAMRKARLLTEEE